MIVGAIPDWTAFVGAIAGVIAALAALVAAFRGHQVNQAVQIPSNGVKLGSLVEGISQVQHMLVNLQNPGSDIPPAGAIARSLEAAPGTDGLRSADTPPTTNKAN